jgi:hypothetical protein
VSRGRGARAELLELRRALTVVFHEKDQTLAVAACWLFIADTFSSLRAQGVAAVRDVQGGLGVAFNLLAVDHRDLEFGASMLPGLAVRNLAVTLYLAATNRVADAAESAVALAVAASKVIDAHPSLAARQSELAERAQAVRREFEIETVQSSSVSVNARGGTT